METSETVPSSERQAALASKPELLEVPFLEYFAAYLYSLFDSENLIIPRLLSIIFWMIAGAILYCLARELVSHDAAIVSVAFFLFLPFGVKASRSFQPDPLMIMMFVATIFSIFKHYNRSSNYSLAIASVLSAFALLVKPVCLFPIFGAFISMKIAKRGLRKFSFDFELIVFTVVSILPSALYYVYGSFMSGTLEEQARYRFDPHLFLEPFYWKGWLGIILYKIGKWPVLISILGVLLIRSELKRSFLVGLWVGYGIFGLVFTYHIYTHNYYHLMLIPIVSLSLGVAASSLLTQMTFNNGIWGGISRLAVWSILVFSIVLSLQRSIYLLDDTGFDSQVTLYEEIGEYVDHNANTIFLDWSSGEPLQYHGKIAGIYWPTTSEIEYGYEQSGVPFMRGEELLKQLISERSPEYFIVSNVKELERQEDLKQALDNKYPKVVETNVYIIYDLKVNIE